MDYEFYRVIGGARIPWRLTVDSSNTVVSEGPIGAAGDTLQTIRGAIEGKLLPKKNPEVARVTLKADQLKSLKELKELKASGGQPALESPGGSPEEAKSEVILAGTKLNIPMSELVMIQFFRGEVSALIPDGRSLYSGYREELEAMGGEGCTNCQKNRLRRKYRNLIKDSLPKGINLPPKPEESIPIEHGD